MEGVIYQARIIKKKKETEGNTDGLLEQKYYELKCDAKKNESTILIHWWMEQKEEI